ncbi:MAG: NAD(P)-binding domain-containing protein [Crocinitomicaceae bacterium]|nr:NAD(P)-binding domain-containing protein [Crocinitomicaceae bacterium]
MKDKFAIIGAGFSGLAMANALKKKNIDFEVFDANEKIGGNWYNVVYNSGHTITPAKMMEFPDFKMPEYFPVFPSKNQILDYLNDFVEKMGLVEHIHQNHAVKSIKKKGDQKWVVLFENGKQEKYTGIILAIGLFRQPMIPTYEGEFSGEILHSSQYKSPDVLRGKNVLVVGAGNSGVDIAVESGLNADRTDVSLRDTPWIIPKTLGKRPITDYLSPSIPKWMKKSILKIGHNVMFGNIESYGMPKPNHKLFTKPPTVNESFIHSLKHGRFNPKTEIKNYEGKKVNFKDGTSQEYDTIIFATGYRPSYKILEEDVIPYENNRPTLVHGVFTPLKKGIYVIGSGVPNNGIGPVVYANANLIAKAIEIQEKTDQPVGSLYANVGEKVNPLRTHPAKCIKRFEKLVELSDSLT